jgi:hypothetical protein
MEFVTYIDQKQTSLFGGNFVQRFKNTLQFLFTMICAPLCDDSEGFCVLNNYKI